MKILGIQKHHNSSACLIVNGELVYYNQEERLSRNKGHFGIPFKCIKEINKITKDIDIVAITGYDYNLHENSLIASTIINEFDFNIPENNTWIQFLKEHHLSHAAKAFYNSNFDDALIVVYDGRGAFYNLKNGEQAYESISVYEASYPNNFKLLYKRLVNENGEIADARLDIETATVGKIDLSHWTTDNTEIEVINTLDLGHYYSFITRELGFKIDEEGKVMGLHSYGKEHIAMPDLLEKRNGRYYYKKDASFIHRIPKEDVAYATQKSFEIAGLQLIQEMLDKSGKNNLVLTGGAALNVVANNYYRKNLPNVNMYVEPLCGDEGNSIGVAQLFYRLTTNDSSKNILNDIYLGPERFYNIQTMNGEELIDCTVEDVVDLLIKQNIVCIYQGGAEAGPRALGNRSILFDPRVKNGKDIVNSVKNRESFRPFACSIMEEYASEWFDIDKSPYMMYAVDALEGVAEKIPSVIHVDNTCRAQTVSERNNKHLYNLLSEFNKKTGVPVLFNTSFNLAGDPIVETVSDAIDTLRKSKLEYLYFPELNKLLYIKND